MDKVKIKDRLKGSGIIVVILSSIAFSIYVMSTYSEQEHFSIMQNKYEKNIKSEYEKYINNIDEFYNEQLIKENEQKKL